MDDKHVGLVAVTQKIDTSTPMGRCFRDLLMLFAQFEREMIAERTYEKMVEQARQGKWGGGYAILGYDAVDKKLVVNPTEAKVVVAIFERYLKLGSLAKTARWANSKEYRTKSREFTTGRSVAARSFTRADVQRLLTNMQYVGKIRFDDVEYAGEHEAIIPMKLFVEVQKLMAARSEKPRRADQKQQVTLLLGLLRCGYCGSAYSSSFVNKKTKAGNTKRYYYYRCGRKVKLDTGACKGADLRADAVDAAFVEFFRKLSQKPEKLEAVLAAAEQASKEGCGIIERERAKLARALSQVERQARALVDRLADPELQDISAVTTRLKELEVLQKRLQGDIAELTLVHPNVL
jgi:site-specific DNA recombinase